ncbi:MAG: Hsp70 family protein [Verrucomicrobiota bacterium]|nr:Hsp70 family protein [Verrucomicrobiota bacterium]
MANFVIGIDLGTSNSAVAQSSPPSGEILDFPILQSFRAGEALARPLLPSFLYAPLPEEMGSLQMLQGSWICGEYARWRGARVPGRLVFSAKSWLCHPDIDRNAPILPWGASRDSQKISPVLASTLLLRHIAQAWKQSHPSDPLEKQAVVITVPASFDEAARGLTVKAAREAGFESFTLLEEPQAAFYHFLSHQQNNLQKTLESVRLVLVVDVGGGTTDLTLIKIELGEAGPSLTRIAVGEHLMLGGDNMDAALARVAEQQLTQSGRKISATQWTQLIQLAREAKEALLGEASPPDHTLSLMPEGSQLLGKSISVKFTRAQVEEILLDGFFPAAPEPAIQSARTGIRELGLPYASDPAITRHIYSFLKQHQDDAFAALGEKSDGLPRPDAILLNGGVFNSTQIAQRLAIVLSSWWPAAEPIRILQHRSLDLAVARGAAYYGLVRRGQGKRISSGTSRSFYLGLATAEGTSAVCILPKGLEEGDMVELKERPLFLTVGQPVQVPLYFDSGDRFDKPGTVLSDLASLQALPPLRTIIRPVQKHFTQMQVFLRAKLTEVGTLELWCVSDKTGEQWKLEFDTRSTVVSNNPIVATRSLPPSAIIAKSFIEAVFTGKTAAEAPKSIRQLWTALEKQLGGRENWPVTTLRELAETVIEQSGRRRKSADHERIFFQLLGYTLRPGYGYPLDSWRVEQVFKLFSQGIENQKEKPVWNEFWIFWRRISGGIQRAEQVRIWETLKPHLETRLLPGTRKAPGGPKFEGSDEMIRLAGALELIPLSEKQLLGDWLLESLRQPDKPNAGPLLWALGRIGARLPVYAGIDSVLEPHIIEGWITRLLDLNIERLDGGAFTLLQIARKTGDRIRDVQESTRGEILARLEAADAPPIWRQLLLEPLTLESADAARAMGDSLPVGLRLV